ncbi:hypothetical protein BV25DRAFT_1837432 [Artomyces pyxidatus]|uniref:Uncharacterized protein n=1 Tax=Artomyces pyxidatus TaxID=48021 RepID=A0ACB8T5T2_9AGAM|nr:hypothetical protein BV25DRAFT_1837432 [Artomyces pyxidatus]
MAPTKRTSTTEPTGAPEAKRTRQSNTDDTDKSTKNTAASTKSPLLDGNITTIPANTVSDPPPADSQPITTATTSTVSDPPPAGSQPDTTATNNTVSVPPSAGGEPATSLSNPVAAVTNPSEQTPSASDKILEHVLQYVKKMNCPTRLIKALHQVLTYSNAEEHIYTPINLPSKLVWRDNHLCARGSPTPIKIWVVGEIRTCWFYDGNGKAQKRVTIRVIPSHYDAISALQTLVRRHTEPREAAAEFVLSDVHASAFSSKRVRGTKESIALPYPNVLDARKKFSLDRTKMPPIGSEFLKAGDIVIQEVIVGRFKTSKTSNNQPDREEVKRISFDLQSVTLLSDGGESDSNDGSSGEE